MIHQPSYLPHAPAEIHNYQVDFSSQHTGRSEPNAGSSDVIQLLTRLSPPRAALVLPDVLLATKTSSTRPSLATLPAAQWTKITYASNKSQLRATITFASPLRIQGSRIRSSHENDLRSVRSRGHCSSPCELRMAQFDRISTLPKITPLDEIRHPCSGRIFSSDVIYSRVLRNRATQPCHVSAE
jgi:hypothetical protein